MTTNPCQPLPSPLLIPLPHTSPLPAYTIPCLTFYHPTAPANTLSTTTISPANLSTTHKPPASLYHPLSNSFYHPTAPANTLSTNTSPS
ncbi:hypothetical protein E2C01_074723 [Portunus trituberculatus]|uniref:Uncharacterized protein n=1 Tax=Portunus trituberculatus TaxID=210409 RepID=A0A5B7IHZ5_PORTR|nr:hypothetical protein [Portunus trituberculatus]